MEIQVFTRGVLGLMKPNEIGDVTIIVTCSLVIIIVTSPISFGFMSPYIGTRRT